MKMIDDLITSFFAKLAPIPTAGKTGYFDEIPRSYLGGKTITEAEYNQKLEEEIAEEREKKKVDNIAAVKRRFENHDEILAVIEKLPEEHKYDVLDFLVSLRKKERDEFNWEKFKNTLIMRGEALQKEENKE